MKVQAEHPHVNNIADFSSALSRWASRLTLVLIVSLAAYLRLYRLGERGFWGDEIWTMYRSLESIPNIIVHYIDLPGPIYYVLAHLSLLLFGISDAEFALRFPSALSGIILVLVCYLSIQRLYGTVTATITALLVAVAPYQIWYAQDARFYALSTLCSFISWFCFVYAIRNNRKISWAFFVASSVLNLYSQPLSAILLLSSIFIVSLILCLSRIQTHAVFKRILLSFTAIAICYTPVIGKALNAYIVGGRIGNYVDYGAGQEMFSPTFSQAWTYGSAIIESTLHGFAAEGSIWILFLAFSLIGLFFLCIDRQWDVFLLIIVCISISFAFFIIGRPANGFGVRYVIFLQPFYLLLVAIAIVRLSLYIYTRIKDFLVSRSLYIPTIAGKSILYSLRALVVLPLLFTSLQSVQQSYIQVKANDWRSIAAYIKANFQPGDIIVGSGWFRQALTWYFDPEDSVIFLNDNDKSALDYAASGERVWYILLESVGGTYSRNLEEILTFIPATQWQPTDLDPVSDLFFPFSEVPARLFFSGPSYLSIKHFYDVPVPNWTDRSYKNLEPGETIRFELMLETQSQRVVNLTFYDGPMKQIDVDIGGSMMRLGGSTTDGWRTERLPVPDTVGVRVPIIISSTSTEANGISDVVLEEAH